MLTLLGINKILAIYVGPAGYAALGQFQNAVQMISTLASGAINTGVTKYTAEYHDNENLQRKVWGTAGTIALLGSLVLGALVLIFREQLALVFLGDASFSLVFVWFAVTLVLLVFNALLLAILNGKKEINKYVSANIAGSLLALIITALMVVAWGLMGALIALAVYQSLAFFATLFLCLKTSWFRWREMVGGIDPKIASGLGKFTAMALTTAVAAPLSHIFVRNHLGETLGWESAGYWEAMSRFSGAYLMLVTSTLGVYYLPKMAGLHDVGDIKRELVAVYKFLMPLTAVAGVLIYLFRGVIIQYLFSREFYPMQSLFGWQVLGDTLKIGAWIISYLMLCKSMTKIYIITEVVFSVLFVALLFLFVRELGLKGTAVAHAITYALYWFAMYHFVYKRLARN